MHRNRKDIVIEIRTSDDGEWKRATLDKESMRFRDARGEFVMEVGIGAIPSTELELAEMLSRLQPERVRFVKC